MAEWNPIMLEKATKSNQNEFEFMSPACDEISVNGRVLVWWHQNQEKIPARHLVW